MRSIPVSEFKASCVEVLEEVNRTGEAIEISERESSARQSHTASITQRGQISAEVLRGTVTYFGDIVEPKPIDHPEV